MARADTTGSRNGGRLRATEPLDETDVEGDEDLAMPSPFGEGLEVTAPDEPSADAPTTESLEEELEDGTPGPEQALHDTDAAVEVLDDERDVGEADLAGEVGEELEWRMGEAGPEPGAA